LRRPFAEPNRNRHARECPVRAQGTAVPWRAHIAIRGRRFHGSIRHLPSPKNAHWQSGNRLKWLEWMCSERCGRGANRQGRIVPGVMPKMCESTQLTENAAPGIRPRQLLRRTECRNDALRKSLHFQVWKMPCDQKGDYARFARSK
jgi:hypothetical protein